ncbi:MAG: hydrogenase expression/formation protein HypE [Pseudomonadota bacterium]
MAPLSKTAQGKQRLHPRRLDLRAGRIELSHGGGGKASAQLVNELMVAAFDNAPLARGDDYAALAIGAERLVMSTDSFVVSPLFFPGGDIGALAVNGTINDIAMAGARPLYLSCGLILEEGFPLAQLQRIVDSMARAARATGVAIVTGDTKVVERGHGDGVFINTTGLGIVPGHVVNPPSSVRAHPGDAVLVSGAIGLHGVAILAARADLPLEAPVASDSAPLHDLVAAMTAAVPDIHVLRDPTRGGLATALNEIAWSAGVGILLDEALIPVPRPVAAACDILGLDPLYVANEGRLIAICAPDQADRLLAVVRSHPQGQDAAIIGAVVEDGNRCVEMKTRFGGRRLVDWLSGEQLPRIC